MPRNEKYPMNKYPQEQIPGEQTSGGPVSVTTSPINTMSKLVETQKSTTQKAHSKQRNIAWIYPFWERMTENKGILLEFIQLERGMTESSL